MLMLVVLAPAGARAQAPGGTATPDTTAAAPDSTAAARPVQKARASWTSDRMGLSVGDLITVVVDEQTAATERVSRYAVGNRSQRNDLNTALGATQNAYNISSGITSDSRDIGEANRTGDLTSVLTVRVVSIEENGIARIEGSKKVTVDGRAQDITLKGVIRGSDVSTSNTILSNRIAEAMITYNGKKIGPRTGIIGKILGMLWP
jgi:flagellar L-ring protein precursor FlgH